MTAAMSENCSTHCDMSTTGGQPGERPGTCSAVASAETSVISINSRSRIFLVTFVDNDAAGLKGPGCAKGAREGAVAPGPL